MSGEIINLRLARKSKDRASHAAEGAVNRVKYGRSRHEREVVTREAELIHRRLDGHHRDTDEIVTEPNDGDAT